MLPFPPHPAPLVALHATPDAAADAGDPAAPVDAEAVQRRFRVSLHGGRVHPLFVALRHHRSACAGAAGA